MTTTNQLTEAEAAAQAKREYMRRWREANRDKMRTAQKKWRDNPANKEKIREGQRNYWAKKAAEMSSNEG